MKLSYAQKLVGLVFILSGILLLVLSAALDSFKCFEFGILFLVGVFPFWGFILFIDWSTRSYK